MPRVRRTLRSAGALLALLLALACTGPSAADAALDTFLLGDGHEGAVSVTGPGPLSHTAPVVSGALAGSSELLTGPVRSGAAGTPENGGSTDQTGFEVGRLVLVLQSTASGPTAPSGDQSPISLPGAGAGPGRWELARISAVSGGPLSGMLLSFERPLVADYESVGAQVVTVPEFTEVSIEDGGAWEALPWDGASGGVTALLASGSIELASADSRISASGRGFRGGVLRGGDASGCEQLDGPDGGGKGEGFLTGTYDSDPAANASRGNRANGGGGGNCSNAGGGGGSNAGRGGTGGRAYDGNRPVGGLGGAPLTYDPVERAVFGGGGGAGDQNNDNGGVGGRGGGFVFVRAAALLGQGRLEADGAAGADSAASASGDGAGGGGAGGVVHARFSGAVACTKISARGGGGGDEPSTAGVHGPGGGGGGGVVLLQAASGSCTRDASSGVAGSAVNGSDTTRGAEPTAADAPGFQGQAADPPPGGFSAPEVAITAPSEDEYLQQNTPTLAGTSSAALALIRIRIDDGPWFEVSAIGGNWASSSPAALVEGPHTMSAIATAFGVTSEVVTRSFIVDTTAPAAPLIAAPAEGAAVPSATPTLSGLAEPLATIEILQDGATISTLSADAAGNWSYTHTTSLPDGVVSFAVRQIDQAQNASAPSAARSFRIDARIPTATIHAKPGAASNSRSASFNFGADEPVTFECSLDASPFSACIAPVSLIGLADGTHDFSVRARDVSGNVSDVATHNWTIDATAPRVSVTTSSPPPGISPSFSFSSDEPVISYRCRVGGTAGFVTCSSPFYAPTLPPGEHTLELRATDSFGNTSQQVIHFRVGAPPVQTPEPPPAEAPPTNPTVEKTCKSLEGPAAKPARVTLVSARQLTRGVRVSLRTNSYVLASVELRRNGRLIAGRAATLAAGRRTLTIRSKRALPKNRQLTLLLSAVTRSGARSALATTLTLRGRSSAILGTDGQAGSGGLEADRSCSARKGSRSLRLKLKAPRRASARGALRPSVRASQWALGIATLLQRGKIVARRAVVLDPARTARPRLTPAKGSRFAAGRAQIRIVAVSADGRRRAGTRTVRLAR